MKWGGGVPNRVPGVKRDSARNGTSGERADGPDSESRLHDWGRRKEKTTAASLRLARVPRVCTHVEKLWPSAVFMSRCALPSALPAVSSPTPPTYQLHDLPHKFTPRLYMESEDPNLVLREIGVWAGWEQAGSANTRSFLLDLLKDEDAHDNFLVRGAGPTRFRS